MKPFRESCQFLGKMFWLACQDKGWACTLDSLDKASTFHVRVLGSIPNTGELISQIFLSTIDMNLLCELHEMQNIYCSSSKKKKNLFTSQVQFLNRMSDSDLRFGILFIVNCLICNQMCRTHLNIRSDLPHCKDLL